MMDTPLSPYRIFGWSLAAALLATPLIAMQFTDEVNWDLADFVFFAVLLGAVGAGLEFAVRMNGSKAYRLGAGVALLGTFLLVWINAAVGIIGSENNPANLTYLGVLVAGLAGAAITRFRPSGMVWAMTAMASATGLVAAITLVSGLHHDTPNSALQLLALNGFFVALFLGSAWLFRIASTRPPQV